MAGPKHLNSKQSRCFTFIENIFRSGLTLVSSNDIITIKIDKKNCAKQKRLFEKKLGCQMDKRETNSDHEMEKR